MLRVFKESDAQKLGRKSIEKLSANTPLPAAKIQLGVNDYKIIQCIVAVTGFIFRASYFENKIEFKEAKF